MWDLMIGVSWGLEGLGSGWFQPRSNWSSTSTYNLQDVVAAALGLFSPLCSKVEYVTRRYYSCVLAAMLAPVGSR